MSLLGGPKSPPQKPCFFGPLVLDFSVHWFWNFRFQVFRAVGPVSGISGSLFGPRNRPQPPLLDQSRALCFQYKCLGKMQFYPFRADGPGADFGGRLGDPCFFLIVFFIDFRFRFFCQLGSRKSGKKDPGIAAPKLDSTFQNIHPVLGRLGAPWGAPRGPLEASWGRLGTVWWPLGASPKR